MPTTSFKIQKRNLHSGQISLNPEFTRKLLSTYSFFLDNGMGRESKLYIFLNAREESPELVAIVEVVVDRL